MNGSLRIRTKYRDQFRSILGNSVYKTGIASAEYKFDSKNLRKFSLGLYSFFDTAGDSQFTTNSYNLNAAVVQNLGNPDAAHHEIGIGFNVGLITRSIDFKSLI